MIKELLTYTLKIVIFFQVLSWFIYGLDFQSIDIKTGKLINNYCIVQVFPNILENLKSYYLER